MNTRKPIWITLFMLAFFSWACKAKKCNDYDENKNMRYNKNGLIKK